MPLKVQLPWPVVFSHKVVCSWSIKIFVFRTYFFLFWKYEPRPGRNKLAMDWSYDQRGHTWSFLVITHPPCYMVPTVDCSWLLRCIFLVLQILLLSLLWTTFLNDAHSWAGSWLRKTVTFNLSQCFLFVVPIRFVFIPFTLGLKCNGTQSGKGDRKWLSRVDVCVLQEGSLS